MVDIGFLELLIPAATENDALRALRMNQNNKNVVQTLNHEVKFTKSAHELHIQLIIFY